MKAWLKGGLIGLVVAILIIISTFWIMRTSYLIPSIILITFPIIGVIVGRILGKSKENVIRKPSLLKKEKTITEPSVLKYVIIIIVIFIILTVLLYVYNLVLPREFRGLELLILPLITFLLPILLSLKFGFGKGFFIGSILAIIYNYLFDFFIIDKWFISVCGDMCGLDNFFMFGISVLFLIIGGINLLIKRTKAKNQPQNIKGGNVIK